MIRPCDSCISNRSKRCVAAAGAHSPLRTTSGRGGAARPGPGSIANREGDKSHPRAVAKDRARRGHRGRIMRPAAQAEADPDAGPPAPAAAGGPSAAARCDNHSHRPWPAPATVAANGLKSSTEILRSFQPWKWRRVLHYASVTWQ